MKKFIYGILIGLSLLGGISYAQNIPNIPIKTFLGLQDTPDTYSGQEGKVVTVSTSTGALVFTATSSLGISQDLSGYLKINQTTPQTTTGAFNFPLVRISTTTDDGASTPLQAVGSVINYTAPDATGLTSTPTYPSGTTIGDTYDNGTTISYNPSASFIDQTVEFLIWGYKTAPDSTRVYSPSGRAYLSCTDGTTTLFECDLAWGNVGADGYVIQEYYGNYWIDAGNVTSLAVLDFSTWNGGGVSISQTSPYYNSNGGSLTYPQNWNLYAYKTTDGVKVFSQVFSSVGDSDPYYSGLGWQTILSWDDVNADGYILENTTGYWVDVGNVTSYPDNGDYSNWTAGPPTVTPTPYSSYGDIAHFYNSLYGIKLNGYGQIDQTAMDATKAPIITPSTVLNTNLNADLLDGHHSTDFQTAGDYLTTVSVTSPLSGAGTSTSPLTVDLSSKYNQSGGVLGGRLETTAPGGGFAGGDVTINSSWASAATDYGFILNHTRTTTSGFTAMAGKYNEVQSAFAANMGFGFDYYLQNTNKIAVDSYSTPNATINYNTTWAKTLYGGGLPMNAMSIAQTYSSLTWAASNHLLNTLPYRVGGTQYSTLASQQTVAGVAWYQLGAISGTNKYVVAQSGGTSYARWDSSTSFTLANQNGSTVSWTGLSSSGNNAWLVYRVSTTIWELFKNGVSQGQKTIATTGSLKVDYVWGNGSTAAGVGVDEIILGSFTTNDISPYYNLGYGTYYTGKAHIYHLDNDSTTSMVDSGTSAVNGTWSGTPTYTASTFAVNITTQSPVFFSLVDGTTAGDYGTQTFGGANPSTVIQGSSIKLSATNLGFYTTTPIAKPSGNALTALSNLGLITSPTLTKGNVGISVGNGTLTAGTTSTITDANATTTSKIFIQPTSSAITVLGVYVSTKGSGSFTLTHLTALGTETFDYEIIN